MPSDGKIGSVVLFLAGTLLACLVSTYAVPTTVTMETITPTTSSSSATPLELFNDVIMGVKVIERLNVSGHISI